jgi:hypothetical protein
VGSEKTNNVSFPVKKHFNTKTTTANNSGCAILKSNARIGTPILTQSAKEQTATSIGKNIPL